MAATVTRRTNALRIDTPDGYAVADVESGRGASAAVDSPPAKHTKDDVWVAADEGEMPGNISGDVAQPLLFRTMKLPKLNPAKRIPDMAALADQYGSSGDVNLPGIDVFVTTVDPVDEPILYTVNTILSILATDYPVDMYACYLSDDGGTLVHYEAIVEVASFAVLWVPFCWKHCVEPRSPENYFGMKTQPCAGGMAGEFVRGPRRVRKG
ncbi:hypothetical protein ACQ4PT_065132 [Festuca glaucescens]